MTSKTKIAKSKEQKDLSRLFDVTNNVELKFQNRRKPRKKLEKNIYSFNVEKDQSFKNFSTNNNSTFQELQKLNADVSLNPKFRKTNCLEGCIPKILNNDITLRKHNKRTSFFNEKTGRIIGQSILEETTLLENGKSITQDVSLSNELKGGKRVDDGNVVDEASSLSTASESGSPVPEKLNDQKQLQETAPTTKVVTDRTSFAGASSATRPVATYVESSSANLPQLDVPNSCTRELSHAKVSQWLMDNSRRQPEKIQDGGSQAERSDSSGSSRSASISEQLEEPRALPEEEGKKRKIPNKASPTTLNPRAKRRRPSSMLHDHFAARLKNLQDLPIFHVATIETLTKDMLGQLMEALKRINKEGPVRVPIDMTDMQILMESVLSINPYDPEFTKNVKKYLEPEDAKHFIDYLKKY